MRRLLLLRTRRLQLHALHLQELIDSTSKLAALAECQGGLIEERFVVLSMHTQTGASSLELKVPPAVLVMIAALFICAGTEYLPEFSFRFPCQSILGWVIGLLGFIGCFLGFLEFRRSANAGESVQDSRLKGSR